MGKEIELIEEMEEYNIKISGASETKKKEKGQIEIKQVCNVNSGVEHETRAKWV